MTKESKFISNSYCAWAASQYERTVGWIKNKATPTHRQTETRKQSINRLVAGIGHRQDPMTNK